MFQLKTGWKKKHKLDGAAKLKLKGNSEIVGGQVSFYFIIFFFFLYYVCFLCFFFLP